MTLYTDIDQSCCAVLRQRIADGDLPPGDVRCADVRTLDADDLDSYQHVHLFAGIGASPLGFHWAGWPDEWSLVTGGFPCQDISAAGKGAGLDGERSGLVWEMLRVIKIKEPMGILAENVGALSARGLDRVAGALEALGYWVEVLRVGAWAVGAPDTRERWWFVCRRRDGEVGDESVRGLVAIGRGSGKSWSDADHAGARGGVALRERTRLKGHRHNAGQPEIAESRHAGESGRDGHALAGVRCEPAPDAAASRCRTSAGVTAVAGAARWPHPRWCVIDENGLERTIPTPQHDWEPPRLFPGTRMVNAQWRLALLGFPLHWLDIDHGALSAGKRSPARWWNTQGVMMTGNAQNPRVVEVLARAMIAAEGDA